MTGDEFADKITKALDSPELSNILTKVRRIVDIVVDEMDPDKDSAPENGVNYEGPGEYRHYKGGHYFVEGLAFLEEDGNKGPVWVIYRPAGEGDIPNDNHDDPDSEEWRSEDFKTVRYWIRPLEDFDAWVPNPHATTQDEAMVRRFTPLHLEK